VTASGPVRVTSLFEAHLPVADVERAVRFYRDVVGLEVAYDDADRGVAFLWAGEPGGAMLGLWTVGTAPMGIRLHVAFAAALDEAGCARRKPWRPRACRRSRSSASRPRSRA
jgi:predicted enzyme related to lactoylglutathione lyase